MCSWRGWSRWLLDSNCRRGGVVVVLVRCEVLWACRLAELFLQRRAQGAHTVLLESASRGLHSVISLF